MFFHRKNGPNDMIRNNQTTYYINAIRNIIKMIPFYFLLVDDYIKYM